MPYDIRQDGEGEKPWCVYKEGTNERLGCTTSRSNAVNMIAAIESSEEDSKAIKYERDTYATLALLLAGRLGYPVGSIGESVLNKMFMISLPDYGTVPISIPVGNGGGFDPGPFDREWDGTPITKAVDTIMAFIRGEPAPPVEPVEEVIEEKKDVPVEDASEAPVKEEEVKAVDEPACADEEEDDDENEEEDKQELEDEEEEEEEKKGSFSLRKAIKIVLSFLSDALVKKEKWSTSYINDLPDSCFLYVESGDKDDEGKTIPRSLRHLPYKDADGKIDLPHLRNAISRLGQSATGEDWLTDSLRSRLMSRARKLLGSDQEEKDFFVVKEDNGRFRWVAISSTAFIDRDHEIVSRTALQKAAQKTLDGEKDRGPLVFWHLKQQGASGEPEYLQIGRCDTTVFDGVALIESGLLDESPIGKAVAQALVDNPERWAVSIGFRSPLDSVSLDVPVMGEKVRTIFDDITIVERSFLPAEFSSNRFTSIMGGSLMDEQKATVLRELLPQDIAQEIITRVDSLNQKAAAGDEVHKEAPQPVETPTEEKKEEAPVKEEKKDAPQEVAAVDMSAVLDMLKELKGQIDELRSANAPRGVQFRASSSVSTVVEGSKEAVPDFEVAKQMAQKITSRLGGGQ